MCDLTSVFEVRSGMRGEHGEGEREGGMFSTFELAKEHADKVIERINKIFDDVQWVSDTRAKNSFYWVEIEEHDVIYPEQEQPHV